MKCLSRGSATVAKLSDEQYIGAGRKDRVNLVETPEAAERAFRAAFEPAAPIRKAPRRPPDGPHGGESS